MKCEGSLVKDSSSVCSVHFWPEDSEPRVKGPRGQESKKNWLKRNAVPSIFSFSDETTLMSALEQKHQPQPAQNNIIIMPESRFPPACLGDGKPCCERESWENLPIVSQMCKTCVMSCREEYEDTDQFHVNTDNKLGIQKNRKAYYEEMKYDKNMTYDKISKHYICKVCPWKSSASQFRAKEKTDMEAHIKNVHLRTGNNVDHMEENQSGGKEGIMKAKDDDFVMGGEQTCDKKDPLQLKECKNASSQTELKQSDIDALTTRNAFLENRLKKHVVQKELKQSDIDALTSRISFLENKLIEHVARRNEDNKFKKHLRNKVAYLLKKKAKLLQVISDTGKKDTISKGASESQEIISQGIISQEIISQEIISQEIISQESVAAMETVGKFLMQSEINVEELLLFSQCKGLVMSKIKQQ